MTDLREPILIGYMPKQVSRETVWLEVPHMVEICSASPCISSWPEEWMKPWLHNSMWVFSDEATARQVIPEGQEELYELHAYRMFAVQFDEGFEKQFEIPRLDVQLLSASYKRLGYDAVSRHMGNSFECSPLSCNSAAKEFEVNEFCLVDDARYAIELARTFSQGDWEPGPYFAVEVLRMAQSQS